MQIFDLKPTTAYPYKEQEKNILYNVEEFITRLIQLPINGEIPTCKMEAYVIFFVIEGSVEVTVNNETTNIRDGQCIIIEPATLSMRTADGVRLMALQINKAK